MIDKRRRNSRPSQYRPRTQAQRQRRRDLWEARADDRKASKRVDDEADLRARYEALETALRDRGQAGVHARRHSKPLEDITDDGERFQVLKARVERLEALWAVDRRKRETRGKIIIGGALLAEAIEAVQAGDHNLLADLLDILDRRVSAPGDRLTVRDLLGGAPFPPRPGSNPAEPPEDARPTAASAPDFDTLVQSAMADEAPQRPSQIDEDYADLDEVWGGRAQG